MKTEQKKTQLPGGLDEMSSMIEEFKQIKGKNLVRTVKLRVPTFCGCGGGMATVTRTVPHDSPLQDGDVISILDVKEDDEIVEEG